MLYRFSPKKRADIGKYACQNGTTAAAKHYSHKLGTKISSTTVQSMKKQYLEERKKKRTEDDHDVSSLPLKKRGRPLLLGEELDTKVQMYLKKVRNRGGVVSSTITVAAAKGILLHCDREKLAEFGGHISLSRQWGFCLLERMKFVCRKATTAKSKQNLAKLKRTFLDELVATVSMEEILPELILNWDQTGFKIVPVSSWTMDRSGSKRVEIVGVDDKRQITAVLCGSLMRDFLPVQLIYKGKTPRCHPRYQFPRDWHITHSPKR